MYKHHHSFRIFSDTGVFYRNTSLFVVLIVLATLDLMGFIIAVNENMPPVTTLIIALLNGAGLVALATAYPWPAEDAAHHKGVDNVGWVGFSITILVATWAVFPFVQPFNDHIFEPDTHLEVIRDYQLFILTLDPANLPHLTSEAPYFDGPYVVYAIISGIIRVLSDIGVISANLQTGAELRIFTLKYTNAVLHSTAIGLMFLCAYRLSCSVIVSALATLAFAACRQIYLTDLARMDQFILPILMLAVYFSVAILQEGPCRRWAIAVGCTIAAFLSCKINGIYVVAFPALAFFLRSPAPREYARFAITAATACAGTLTFLMFRYILHVNEVVYNLIQKLWAQEQWAEMVGNGPMFYYNFDIFGSIGAYDIFPSDLGRGFEWIPCLWVASGMVVVLCLPALAIVRRRREPLYFPILLVVFSLIGVLSYKYTRGGYHLVPIIILGCVHCAAVARDPGRRELTVAIGALGALSMISLIPVVDFTRELRIIDARFDSLRTSRLEARDWLAEHVCVSARVCTFQDGAWGNPSLEGLSLSIVRSALDIPYLDKNSLAIYEPPSLDVLSSQCDAVVLNDYIKHWILVQMHDTGLEKLNEHWGAFFTSLAQKHAPLVFSGVLPLYGTKQIEFYILNNSAQTCSG
jgi:hypothetical protein